MKVLKFGGSSIGSPGRMKSLYSIIQTQTTDRTIVVLSAIFGTTNKLVHIVNLLKLQEKQKVEEHITDLKIEYQDFIYALLKKETSQTEALFYLRKSLKTLNTALRQDSVHIHECWILAQGELLSTRLLFLYLQEKNIDVALLPALDFMKLNENGEPDLDFIQGKLHGLLSKEAEPVFYITQGFISRNWQGAITNLNRGGSDYTASLIGAAIKAEEIQIWTDIDGFHNNDPRFVKNTRPIQSLSFNEAAELAYFGAKILHPQSILPAKNKHIPVRLLNTLEPLKKGTLISDKCTSEGQIVALAAKDHITAIRIQSSRMFLAHGFLRKVFDVFEYYKTPIDMITTSEVAVSLTIDDNKNLDQIIRALEPYGKLEVHKNQSIVCAVGDFGLDTHNGHASIVTEALKHIPIRMISYGGSEHNISLLLPGTYKKEALRALHCRLF